MAMGADKPDYFTTAVFYGPDIKKRAQVEHAELVDEGPTFAELLGLSYPRPTAGKPIKGIFKEVKHENLTNSSGNGSFMTGQIRAMAFWS